MIPAFAQAFTYQIPWKSSRYQSGDHRGLQAGIGAAFKGNVPLINYPDPRRIDVAQTIRDIGDEIHVRTFNEKNSTHLFALCDLSASMQFRGRRQKMELVSEVAGSIGLAAYNAGDKFAVLGYDQLLRPEWCSPLGSSEDGFRVVKSMRGFSPSQPGCDGVLAAAEHLGRGRALVFWISDFHMPLALVEKTLNVLSRHKVVPIVVWDSAEYKHLPRFGITSFYDPETGAERTLFFRNALRQKFVDFFEARRVQLQSLLVKYQSPPFFVEDVFNSADLTAYFQRYVAP